MNMIGCSVLVLASVAALGGTDGVKIYRTTGTREFREVVGALPSAHTGSGARVIDLDAAVPRQAFLGLGVSFPEASCHLMMRLKPEQRAELLGDIFGPGGLNLSVGRIHMGSSDYSRHLYTYDDTPGDVALKRFSIDEDRPEVLPVIKAALKVNPDLYFFASPWSPPGWMKDSESLCGGHLKPSMVPVYADYVVRFLGAYAKEGVGIGAVTIQNEPGTRQESNSPTCLYTSAEEVAAIRALAPKLTAAGLKTKIWVHDHNFDGTNRVATILADEAVRRAVGGIAWHPYEGEPEMVRPIGAAYPELPMYVTEMGPHIDRAKRPAVWWGRLMARSFNSGNGAFVGWCLALDEEGQPNVSLGFPCAGLIEIHSETGAVTPSSQYKAFRHVSPFVRRGARVLDAPIVSGPNAMRNRIEGLDCVAVRNPDGSHVIFFARETPGDEFSRLQVQIKWNGRYLPVQVFGNALTTVVIPKTEK